MSDKNPSYTYDEIYKEKIINISKGIIFKFSNQKMIYDYTPFCHGCEKDAIENLSTLMKKNLVFYCYGEEEIINKYSKGKLNDLQTAAMIAYESRLPHREPVSDGLPGEVLLDMLIQMYCNDCYKLAVRTLFRQQDNNEIKGYDLTYFYKNKFTGKIELWLGQSKLGDYDYCKKDIHKDLITKYNSVYFSKQLLFISDKPVEITSEARHILDTINEINEIYYDKNIVDKSEKLVSYLNANKIGITIPCLLSYDCSNVYNDPSMIYNQLEKEIKRVANYYESKSYNFEKLNVSLVFYLFPIRSINELRSVESGFYCGLRK